MDTEGVRVCARRTNGERERGGEKLRRWVVELSIHSAHPSPPTRSGLCAFESRGSRGFPGEDVHRFLSSDRPFEQQPTWKTETRLSVCTVCTPSASLSFPSSLWIPSLPISFGPALPRSKSVSLASTRPPPLLRPSPRILLPPVITLLSREPRECRRAVIDLYVCARKREREREGSGGYMCLSGIETGGECEYACLRFLSGQRGYQTLGSVKYL